MIKIFIILLGISFSATSFAEKGILFLAHGSMKHHQNKSCSIHGPTNWEQLVIEAVRSIKVNLKHESEVAFGMWNSKCFDKGIKRLEKSIQSKGEELDHLIVLPIFVSSYSAVIEMQKFIFKKRPDRVIPIPSVVKTYFKHKITYLPAIDYNPQISMILSNRFHKLIHLAKQEGYKKDEMELVLVMHGPVSDQNNKKWIQMAEKYVTDISYLFPVKRTHIISLRDDAPREVRDIATKKLREIVSIASTKGRKALVLPLLLSKGGIEQGILDRLIGLDYIWSGETLLPDEKIGPLLFQYLINYI